MARDPRARQDPLAELDLDLAALARTGPGPYHVEAELPAAWIAGVLAHTDAEVSRDGRVAVEVTSMAGGTNVLVRGRLAAGFTVPCARCLEPAEVELGAPAAGVEVCVHFVRGAGDAMQDEEGRDWDESGDTDSPDQRSFIGTHLDLRPMVEEQILVAYPIRALCARGEACRGLCMHCGANLNEQPAGLSRCIVCKGEGPQVQVVAAPGDEDEEDAPGPAAETPWQAALRGLKVDGPGRKKPPSA